MNNPKVLPRRLAAFAIDAMLVAALLIGGIKLEMWVAGRSSAWPPLVVMGLGVPVAFLLYWLSRVNLGKRLFRLQVVDAATGEPARNGQYLLRCLPFCLLVSFNLLFLIPVLVSRRQQGFHDMLAGTCVVARPARQAG